ncbi:peptidase M28 [Patiriisocius marinistellae]|uniref:Peptidase M28 n=1 Tax=Patiriisocius marinistellae TaxID=2494560 RepID=A0A5J4G200_9FLAO|nr:M28 family metallopeptidase [Patiriisocius marinistellae]GEQ86111.1 peptidase M28 [Patiriisocius marinistellae]
MKYIALSLIASLVFSCNANKTTTSKEDDSLKYANSITAQDLKTHLYIYAGDEMEGRMTGAKGQKMAVNYLRDFYKKQGIAAPAGYEDYFQHIPADYFKGRQHEAAGDSENVVAFIKGSEFPDEIIVLSAHLDHVGMDDEGNVFNGADDDGSGTVAMLEMAEAFQKAVKEGNGPKRSILFLHVTGEEIGLFGSRYYTENPIFPLANTVCDLNTDMIGRIDPDKADTPNYIYLIGSDKLSNELHNVSEEVAKKYSDLELDYTYNDENDPNRFYYRSDHYNFAKNNVPIIFYFNGVHADYHKISDTPDKIEYDLMTKRTKLIFHTAWEVANRDVRITADKIQ